MKAIPEPIAEFSEPSEYLQEVLATPPRWIVRWGQVGVFVLVIVLFILSWFIRYPDRISGKVVITSLHPAIGVIAQTDGYILDLLVADHDTVEAGEVLAIIQNPARYGHVMQLQETLQTLSSGNLVTSLSDSLLFPAYQLGNMQEYYTKLQTAWLAYQQNLRLNPHNQERLSINAQITQYQQLAIQKQTEKELLDRKSQLVEKDFLRNKQLFATQAIAEKTLEISEQQWLEAKYAAESISSELLQIQLDMGQLRQKQQMIDIQHAKTENELHSTLLIALDNLHAALSQLEERYLLRAPQAGKVSLFNFQSPKQYVHALDTVMFLLPENEEHIFGRLLVPVQNFGKVQVGQRVEVYLDNYSYEEYGSLPARVEDFSDLPQQGFYRVIISFPEELKTQYGNMIPAQPHLQGQAEIITEERRLIERLFDKLRVNLFTKNIL